MSASDKTVVVDGGGSGLGSALVVIVLIVALFVGGVLLYRAGVFGGHSKHEIDINVNKPGTVLLVR
jgi:hypothetical protein